MAGGSNAEKLVSKVEKLLPEIIYDSMEGDSILWNHSFQRNETAKRFAIFTIEREIKILESIRGEYISFHKGQSAVPIEEKIKELFQLIKDINAL